MILALTFGGLILVKDKQQTDAEYQAARQEYEQSKQVVPEDAAAHRPYTGDKSYREEWRAEQDLEAQRAMAWWSKLATVATCIGVLLLAATLWETTRTTKAAAEATEAARKSVEHAEQTAQRELRAYVVQTDGHIRNFGLGLIPQAHVVVKNAGQTPGYEVSGYIGMGLDAFPPPVPVPQPPADMLRNSVSVIGPNCPHHLTKYLAGSLTEAHLTGLEEGSLALHVVGKIDYRDAFGQWQHTTFSMFYGGAYGVNENGVLAHGPQGNEAT